MLLRFQQLTFRALVGTLFRFMRTCWLRLLCFIYDPVITWARFELLNTASETPVGEWEKEKRRYKSKPHAAGACTYSFNH